MKPILFKDEMVKAILAGNKTQTRREKGLQFLNDNPDEWTLHKTVGADYIQPTNGKKFILLKDPKGKIAVYSNSPYGWIGDQLWVREAIYMPRNASRLTLEIVDMRIERLMDISEQDAIAEGVEIFDNTEDGTFDLTKPDTYLARDYLDNDRSAATDTARYSFHTLWQSINGIESYKKNPWVWVIVFKRSLF